MLVTTGITLHFCMTLCNTEFFIQNPEALMY